MDLTKKEDRAFVDQLLVHIQSKPDKQLIHVSTDRQRAALKIIMDANYPAINGYELTFCNCFQWIRKSIHNRPART